ncbi:uncharacterized protein HMPREF1541_07411 [Cyphellophora europaea CBS 101466]|uniref:Amino acid transporter transmembrane domain-containing protein n=1 Tax=Cyphellophora europaea (strain CBS 101466) TaxID=1220924 RepID=W2RQ02_CYPE1|nr:uncharacterized protein HMPREF1541_07411 [Cyphellophora europaea CBS 101466]ETN37788.1 hypothetical protein HMPREF1541_07411 [Cyphellophora europaea CBS 101466]
MSGSLERKHGSEDDEGHPTGTSDDYHDTDVFGREDNATIKYKTLSWQMCSVLMIAEIVSNGMLSLPAALAVVGIVPGLLLIAFLGIFALYTSLVLVDFKLRHPEVHNMGDAGMIMGGPVLREILSAGTVIFAVFATGSQLLAGQIALSTLSDNKLCLMIYTGIFAVPTFLVSLFRTLDHLSLLSVLACIGILAAGIVGMAGAGAISSPQPIETAKPSDFYHAFLAITNPVFSYAGHFMFFILISEMSQPKDAKKAAWTLQIFATTVYCVFAAVMYVYLGDGIASPAFSSLPSHWSKAAYGIALPNFLIAGSLYAHTAAKLFFVRLFRRPARSRHLHHHTLLGWAVWAALVLLMNAAAFVLAVGVPIFAYLVSIAASLFASWYTYGIAGAFWLFDAWHDHAGWVAYRQRWGMCLLNCATFLAGFFICVAGMYISIKLIVDAYSSGAVGEPFSC